MTTLILQCHECKFFKTLHIIWPKDKYVCSEYPNGIPNFVEDTTKDCPKFEVK